MGLLCPGPIGDTVHTRPYALELLIRVPRPRSKRAICEARGHSRFRPDERAERLGAHRRKAVTNRRHLSLGSDEGCPVVSALACRIRQVTIRAFPAGAAYTADRAAALAGIPLSTLHYWARKEIWIPSVSSTTVKRWSYSDLLALRLINWLRRDKPDLKLPKTSMAKIRGALAAVERLGDRLREHSVKVWVDPKGGLVVKAEDEVFVPLRRGLAQALTHLEGLDLVEAWQGENGVVGPHLFEPRSTLRIIPGKLSGEPHVVDTRIPTTMLSSLRTRGLEVDAIIELYPRLTHQNVEEAIALEVQLDRNLRAAA